MVCDDCGEGKQLVDGKCVCIEANSRLENGICICDTGFRNLNGQCVPCALQFCE